MYKRKKFEISGIHQHVMLLRMCGFTIVKIAERVNKDPSTIVRWLGDERFKKAYKEYVKMSEQRLWEKLNEPFDKRLREEFERFDEKCAMQLLRRQIKAKERRVRKKQEEIRKEQEEMERDR